MDFFVKLRVRHGSRRLPTLGFTILTNVTKYNLQDVRGFLNLPVERKWKRTLIFRSFPLDPRAYDSENKLNILVDKDIYRRSHDRYIPCCVILFIHNCLRRLERTFHVNTFLQSLGQISHWITQHFMAVERSLFAPITILTLLSSQVTASCPYSLRGNSGY